MKKLIFSLVFLVTMATQAASSFTHIKVELTGIPANNNTVTVGADVRTFKTVVTTPSTQILIGGSAAATAANYETQIGQYPYITAVITEVSRNGAIVTLTGPVGTTSTASRVGANITVTVTQTSITQYPLNLPLSGAPASRQVQAANDLIDGVEDYATTVWSASTPALANHVNLSASQTISGAKTFTGATTLSNASTFISGGSHSNTTVKTMFMGYDSTHPNGLEFFSSVPARISTIAPDASGIPSIYGTAISENPSTGLSYSPASENILTRGGGNVYYGQLAADNTWSKTNTFTRIAGTLIVDSILLRPVMTNGVNYGNPFSSPGAGASSEQYGASAAAAGSSAVAIGNTATASAANDIAIGTSASATAANAIAIGTSASSAGAGATALGRGATAPNTDSVALGHDATAAFDNATALGANSAATAASQVRLGATGISTSVPLNASIGNNLAVGNDWLTFVASMAGGVQLVNGTAPSTDPASSAVFYVVGGELFYRGATASEGAGQANRVHNRAAEVVGSGTDFAIAGTAYAQATFSGTTPVMTLPTAGTYQLSALVEITNGATANDVYSAKFYDSTAAADISNSEQTISNLPAATIGQVRLQSIATLSAGSHVIQLYVKNATAARGSVIAVLTKVSYIRLY